MSQLLIVEDDIVTLFIYEEWFDNNSDVFIAKNVSEALRFLDSNPSISHILSDFNLDDQSAVELFSAIKDISKYKLALALGSDLKEEHKLSLNVFKVEQYFKKPIDLDAINQWLEQK